MNYSFTVSAWLSQSPMAPSTSTAATADLTSALYSDYDFGNASSASNNATCIDIDDEYPEEHTMLTLPVRVVFGAIYVCTDCTVDCERVLGFNFLEDLRLMFHRLDAGKCKPKKIIRLDRRCKIKVLFILF